MTYFGDGNDLVSMAKDVLIVGAGKTAEVIYCYFSQDRNKWNVVGFAEDNPKKTNLFGKHISPLNTISTTYSKEDTYLFIAVGVDKLNTTRQKLYEKYKKDGWQFATYISPRATVAKTVHIGENCIVMDENTIQDFVSIGNNNILWSGNHIGHHTTIGYHNFISSHVVICGSCNIGDNNFFGVNSVVGDEVIVGSYNWFSPLTGTVRNIGNEKLLRMPKPEIMDKSTIEYFKLDEYK